MVINTIKNLKELKRRYIAAGITDASYGGLGLISEVDKAINEHYSLYSTFIPKDVQELWKGLEYQNEFTRKNK